MKIDDLEIYKSLGMVVVNNGSAGAGRNKEQVSCGL